MSLKKIALGAAAGITFLVSTAAAFAYPATSTTPLNVRSGPGPNYGVVDVIQPGEVVDVQGCQGSWCDVGGGWASARYLTQVNAVQTRPRANVNVGVNIGVGSRVGIGPWWHDDGYYGFRTRRDFYRAYSQPGFSVNFGNPNFRFSIGTGSSRAWYEPFDYWRGDDCFEADWGQIYCRVN